MSRVKKWMTVLICVILTAGSWEWQIQAAEENKTENQTQESESISSRKEVEKEAAAEPRIVPTGYADMRVGKMTDEGFIRSNGIYAEYYYSARWAGEELSNEDTILKPGQITYCIDPDTPLIGENGDEAYGKIGGKDVIRNITTDRIETKGVVFRMLGRILQVCGTDLTDGSELASNAAEGTKYVATQMIIWQIIWGDMDEDFNLVGNTWKKYGWEGMKYYNTAPKGGKSVKQWYDLWITELKNSKKIPSFTSASEEKAATYEMKEDSITLVDNRDTLQYMKVHASDPAVKITVSGNKLVIENPQRVSCTVTLTNTVCEGAKEPSPILAYRLSDGEDRQTTIVASATELDDPVQGFFKIKATPATADLVIQKEVEQDEYLKSSLQGYQFMVQSTQTGYSKLHETDAEGKICIQGLKVGTYIIEEVKKEGVNTNGCNMHFELPSAVTVEVGADQEKVTQVAIKNRLRRGTLKVFKVDAAQPSNKLSGVKLMLEKKVYDLPQESASKDSLKDENGSYQWKVVGEKTTDKKGEVKWENLTVGEYRLTETRAAEGYQLLAEEIIFSLPSEETDSWSSEADRVSIGREFVLQNLQAYNMPESGGREAWLYISAFVLCTMGIVLGIRLIQKGRKRNET